MLTFDSLKIWFIRHAESEANLRRIYANEGLSFPLTVNGLQQARAFAQRFSSLEIRAVYKSPILRKQAKFVGSHFARSGTTTTRGLRMPSVRIRRDTFAYLDGVEPINGSP